MINIFHDMKIFLISEYIYIHCRDVVLRTPLYMYEIVSYVCVP